MIAIIAFAYGTGFGLVAMWLALMYRHWTVVRPKIERLERELADCRMDRLLTTVAFERAWRDGTITITPPSQRTREPS